MSDHQIIFIVGAVGLLLWIVGSGMYLLGHESGKARASKFIPEDQAKIKFAEELLSEPMDEWIECPYSDLELRYLYHLKSLDPVKHEQMLQERIVRRGI